MIEQWQMLFAGHSMTGELWISGHTMIEPIVVENKYGSLHILVNNKSSNH